MPFQRLRRLLPLLLLLLALGAPAARAEGPRGITALAWEGEALWLGTTQGLARWQAGRVQAMEFPLAGTAVTALLPEGGALWVGTRAGLARRAADGSWRLWARGEPGVSSDWVTAWALHEGAPVAGSLGGGAMRWTGDGWAPLGAGSPSQITALAADGPRLWAGTASGLWAWEGEQWAPIPLADGVATRINTLLLVEGTLWAGTDEGLYQRSGDGGWSEPLVEGRIVALGTRQGTVVAATPLGLVDQAGDPLPGGPSGAISALAPQGARLAVGTLDAGLHLLPPEPSAEPARPPVVLVHGLGDSNRLDQSQFRFMAEWLRRDGYALWLAPSESESPFLTNVAQLRYTITEARQATGATGVILIAHSFGGLIARAYLQSGATDVLGLATLGSPHAGVDVLYDSIADTLPDATPSEAALLPEHVALLRPANADAATPQLHIGGTLLPRDALLAGFPPLDGYISAASATDAPGATRLRPLLHGWTVASIGGGIESLTWPDPLYQGTLLPWMEAVARGEPWQDRAESLPLPSAGFTRTPLVDQPLAPGERLTRTVPLEGDPTTWLLDGEGIRTTLIAPDGSRYGEERLLLSPTVARLPATGFGAARLWSVRDRPGAWQIELDNPTATVQQARLALIRPERQTLTIEPVGWATGGESLTIRATGPSGLALTARLSGAESAMREEGEGRYLATLPAPTRWGYHRLRVGSEAIERFAVVGVRSQRFTLTEASGDALTLSGEGQVALLLTLEEGTTRLVGPYRFRNPGLHRIRLPLGAASWVALDATRELLPIQGAASPDSPP